MEVTEKELKIARGAASRVYRVGKSYVEYDDILQEIYVWMVKKNNLLEQWREDGRKGEAILKTALYRAGLRYLTKERIARTGAEISDFTFYTDAMVEDLLPHIWDHDDWTMQSVTHSEVSSRSMSRPSEGGNYVAMLCDVRSAVYGLPKEDIETLQFMFDGDGHTFKELAEYLEVSIDTARRTIARITNKLVDKLGGEPPWWRPSAYKSKSNAQAQAELSSD